MEQKFKKANQWMFCEEKKERCYSRSPFCRENQKEKKRKGRKENEGTTVKKKRKNWSRGKKEEKKKEQLKIKI
jgi:hypothetical protein